MDRFINLRGLPVMRQIVAIALLYFAATLGVSAADNNEVQQGIFDSYLKLANEGDVVAQYVVAQRYENGKGTGKDMEKAYYWYEMAAKQNYPLALVKLEARDHQNTVKAEPPAAAKTPIAPTESTPTPTPPPAAVKKEPAKKPAPAPSQPKPKPAKAPEVTTAAVTADASPRPAKPAARRDEPKPEIKTPVPEIIVAKAPPVMEPPKPDINVTQALLAGKWKRNQEEAEYLPSANAACLQSSNTEIVCFSGEMTRNIDNAGLTYNVKSVISGFNNREAKFNLRYVYNVVHVASKPHSAPNGMSSEMNDMAVKTGWQEPGVAMECRLRDEHSLSCTRNDRRMTYQFVRE
jgi:hypothetical protein